jgi:hypothetical protein
MCSAVCSEMEQLPRFGTALHYREPLEIEGFYVYLRSRQIRYFGMNIA